MKKFILFLACVTILFSCENKNDLSQDTDAILNKNLEEIEFYSYSGASMSLSEIKAEWDNMVNESQTPEFLKAGTFEIKKIQIADSDAFEYAIVATNYNNQIQTAAIIESYKNGYKISNRSTSCYNCDVNLTLSDKERFLYCSGDDTSSSTPCIKTSRIIMD